LFHLTPIKIATVAVILFGLAVYAAFGGYFARELVIQVAILAILAISLDMIAGYGGMVSLCHGAILGLGAYAFAIVNVLLGGPPLLALIFAMLMASVFGAAVGAVTSRTRGIFFIMATLAFGQMLYVMIFDSRTLGGDDGLWGLSRLDMSAVGVDLKDGFQFALFCLFCLALTFAAASVILRSAFGRTICGIHENEDRMRALGITVWKFKSAAFGLSGAFAGLAGALAAQHTMFVSPELVVWMGSGEALVVVILGGLGTLAGPVVGAVSLVFLKHIASNFTNYWHVIIGLILIITVVTGTRGIYGSLETFIAARRARTSPKAREQSDA
jgi:branched-chain amino acid transport system permease protein